MIRFYLFLFILLGLLAIRLLFFFNNQPQYQDGDQVDFTTILLEQPRVFHSYQLLTVFLENGQFLQVYASRNPSLDYGDFVRISGTIKTRVLMNKKTVLVISFPKIEAKQQEDIFVGQALALSFLVRQNIVGLFEKTLPQIASSLLVGIVFGIKEDTPKAFADALRNTGVMHVVAASGTNVVLVVGFLSALFGRIVQRRWALGLSIIGILFYTALAGFSPSIVRASIMGSLVCVAQIVGRQYMALYGLFLTGVVMLFISPRLLFDIGFQLSFAATLGLIVIRPMFAQQGKIKQWTAAFPIGEDALTTIAAQITTLPLLLYHFGTYSLWSVFVNIIVLWTIPILMVLGGIAAFVGVVLPFLGQILLYLALPLLWYFETVVLFFGKQGGMVTFTTFPWQLVAGYYFCLGAWIVFIKQKEIKS